MLKEGDILFARSGGTVGKTFQFKNYKGSACYAGYLIKAEPNSTVILSDFLYQYTGSGIYNAWIDFILNKSTIENIGADKYCNLQVVIPPLEEQKIIVAYISTEISKIDDAIIKFEKEIQLIEEYKTCLIGELVTGKVDVRDVKIDEFLELETLDEIDVELEAEELTE